MTGASHGSERPFGVLFVCMGNICRSPMGEAVFRRLAEQRGVAERFDVDSCGIGGWHAGERADPRTIAAGQAHGIAVESIARQLDPGRDAERFDLIVAMDRSIREYLLDAGMDASRVRLMRSFDPRLNGKPARHLDVPDPYTGEQEAFDRMYAMIAAACAGLLDELTGGC